MLQEEVIKGQLEKEIFFLSVELYDGDIEKAIDWLCTDNDYFFGKSPTLVNIEGNGQAVIDLLNERLGK